MISLLAGNCFPSHVLLSTQEFVPAGLGDAVCYPVLVTQAEGNFPGVPAVHVCVDAYQALRLCSAQCS